MEETQSLPNSESCINSLPNKENIIDHQEMTTPSTLSIKTATENSTKIQRKTSIQLRHY
jgi:hypothetical protein